MAPRSIIVRTRVSVPPIETVTPAFFPFWPFPSLSLWPTRDGRHGRHGRERGVQAHEVLHGLGRVHADGAHGGGDGARASPDPPGRGVRVRRIPHRGTAHGLRGVLRVEVRARRGAARTNVPSPTRDTTKPRGVPPDSVRSVGRPRRPSLTPRPPAPLKPNQHPHPPLARDPLLSPAETPPGAARRASR